LGSVRGTPFTRKPGIKDRENPHPLGARPEHGARTLALQGFTMKDMKSRKGWDAESVMAFMLFMVKAVSEMVPNVHAIRVAQPEVGASSAPPAPSVVKVIFRSRARAGESRRWWRAAGLVAGGDCRPP